MSVRPDFDGHRDVWGPLLALQLRTWAELVFKPAQTLRASGVWRGRTLGAELTEARIDGSGPRFATGRPGIHEGCFDPAATDRLRFFDMAAEDYVSAIGGFTAPVREELERIMARHVGSKARLLDACCGPGEEAACLAGTVPEGEVVALDLSLPCLEAAHRNARERGASNCEFFRLDVQSLPAEWDNVFDVVVLVLALHYLEDVDAAVAGFRRVLAPGGMAFVAEPGAPMLNQTAAPLVRRANPAFVAYRTPENLIDLFERAGFTSVHWREVLPGIGVLAAVA